MIVPTGQNEDFSQNNTKSLINNVHTIITDALNGL